MVAECYVITISMQILISEVRNYMTVVEAII